MRKMVVFNVGGALSAFLDIDGKKVLVDVGKSETFNPVVDFMIPLFERNLTERDEYGKFIIEQLIVSHPHMDHISAITDFDERFTPYYLTCPNDKEGNVEMGKLDFSQFDEGSDEVKTLRSMYESRGLPLTTFFKNDGSAGPKQYLFYIKPGEVAATEELTSGGECYQNNVSLVSLFVINNYYVLFPGDIMKGGMRYLINDAPKLRRKLGLHGVDILVAPHHGLKSSFCSYMFDVMGGHKTRCLNIIPEKINGEDSREVDARYYSKDYCEGRNNLDGANGGLCFGRKTSRGHICVDFDGDDGPVFEVIEDSNKLVDWFLP